MLSETWRTVARIGLGIAIMTALVAAIIGAVFGMCLALAGAGLLYYSQTED